ncbi:potassium-transporting ATPase subunit KdpC [Roseococcus sp. SDR]|uniref:potassium-transporting ATPase subunit KdpC n=1 Tax=Roseococcus sp. SDR TaxID=2835532 RepID=UPI001BCD8F26|nr:potassium-transporting ATPase subunit KdpC [Roseococcus sp. SDR]MBS7790104.1 potassium-transporting ATPase subunit KdpC [Roseococcus sp. SDR]MBV1845418.1 potassium-transporting ATPase subunit KdpC [Roseococcus sp. SDR]
MLRPLLSLLLGGTLLLGMAVPVGVTALAGLVLPEQAGGSLIRREGQVIGSALVGQDFQGDRWFQGRPSATSAAPYDASSSAASQLGPTSAALLEAITTRLVGARDVPADAVTASGSGLDPHISVENAREQIPRVAAARNLPAERIFAILERSIEGRELGLLGEPRVNVLRLNLALEAVR